MTSADGVTPLDQLVYEDPYEDEWGSSSDEEDGVSANSGNQMDVVDATQDDDEEEEEEEDDAAMDERLGGAGGAGDDAAHPAIWRGNIDDLPEGEKLDFNEADYVTYHQMKTPCKIHKRRRRRRRRKRRKMKNISFRFFF